MSRPISNLSRSPAARSMKALCAAWLGVALSTGAAEAAVTYKLLPVTSISCCDPGSIDVVGTITTDGTIGVLSTANIIGWDITLSDEGHPDEHLSSAIPSNSVLIEGLYLTTTAKRLYWNFAQGTGADFSITDPDHSTTQWHIFTNRWSVQFNNIEYANYQTGNQLIGLSAPEPHTWTLMILGMFGMGAALRARRQTDLAPEV
jgi:hypothetical protein